MKIAKNNPEANGAITQLKDITTQMLESIIRNDQDAFIDNAEAVNALTAHVLGIEQRVNARSSTTGITMSLDETFAFSFAEMSSRIHDDNCKKGFWSEEGRNDGEVIALMHSELSEALEALRHGNPASDKIPSYSNLEEELADTVIRIMDYAAAHDLRIAEAVLAKLDYNRSRPPKHGKGF
jgi:NTP pyrophosphatase (non-canonical NTP hydrolase)